MKSLACLVGGVLLAWLTPADAADLEVPVGTPLTLATIAPLSSRTDVKGELVPLTVRDDVRIGGRLAIAAGTAAVGQIVDARAKGALGMAGRLVLRPLYLTAGGRTIRLTGSLREQPGVGADLVIGLAVISGGLSGRSAAFPAGTPIAAEVERAVTIDVP